MLVSVTGGTGFVGAHSVAELARRGRRVRLLVRDRSRVEAALDPLGVAAASVDVVVGDVTDAAAVEAAVRGADAVLHAAGVYSFDSRQRAAVRHTNLVGTETVLSAARQAGVGPIVHVSSVGALWPTSARSVGPGSPVGTPAEPYLAGKAAADRVARRYQADGDPVVISYPPALLGPADPHLGDQNARLRNVLRGLMPVWPRGGLPLGDVRDTAAVHAGALTEGHADGRVFGPGHFLSTQDYVAAVRAVTGRSLPTAFLPAGVMLPAARPVDLLQRVWPWHIPAESGAVYVCAVAVPTDPTAPAAGAAGRPIEDTLHDTVRWLYRTGRLSARQAGAVARRPVPTAIPTGRPVS